MAEEDPTKLGLLKLDNPNMKTSYANFSHLHVNATDLYLYFGIQDGEGGVENVAIENRIVLTHDSFMRMMEFWSTRYSMLEAIYGDTPRNLRDFDHETVQQAFADFIGLQLDSDQKVPEEQEDPEDQKDA